MLKYLKVNNWKDKAKDRRKDNLSIQLKSTYTQK